VESNTGGTAALSMLLVRQAGESNMMVATWRRWRMPATVAGSVLALGATLLAPGPATAAPILGTVSAPSQVRAGQVFTISGAPGAALAGRVVVLEVDEPVRAQVATGYVTPRGTFRLRTALPIADSYQLKARVINGKRTAWQSRPIMLTVEPGGRRSRPQDVASGLRMVGHAQTAAKSRAIKPKMLSAFDDDFDLAEDLDDLAEGAAQSGSLMNVVSSALSSPLVSFVGEAAGEWGVGLALNLLMSAVFPGSDNSTSDAVAQISSQLQQVQNQLTSIENSLSSLEAQVTQEYAQLNAVASDSLCISLLNEANGYVDTIQLAQDNMQLVMTPAWLQANVGPYANSTAGIRAIGNQVFGSGSGTPSFSSGVFATQQAVTNLGNVLIDDQATGSTGLITACSTAIAAMLAANPSALAAQGTSIVPVGAVDNAYFISLQQIVGYYSGWVSIGQTIAAQGGQMTVAMLSPEPMSTASQVTGICNGTTASGAPNLITCSGILAQISQTQSTLASAWNATGASWTMVSNGLFAADTQVNPAAGGLASPLAIWPVDLGWYGQTSSSQPVSPSTGSASGPASSVVVSGVIQPQTTTWMGLNFTPAQAPAWDRLLQVVNTPPYPGASSSAPTACAANANGTLTSCAAAQTVGAAMNSAGLLVNGQPPSNLILYTGQTSTWNPLNSALISDARLFDYIPGEGYVGLQPPIISSAPSYTVQAFLDTSMVPVQGASVVIGNPLTSVSTLTPASIYPYYSAPGSNSSWTATLSPTLASPATGTVLASCPSASNQNNPYPGAAPLTLGAILGLAAGTQGTLGSQLNSLTSGACTSAPASASPSGGVVVGGSGLPLVRNSAFYAPITAAGTNFSQNGESFATLAWNSTSLPGFIGANPQQQYVWPVANPATPGCSLTSFSEGLAGQSNTTQTCLGLWQEWSAVYNAQTTGPVTLIAPSVQGTIQASGQNSSTVVLSNTSSSVQSATLTVATASGGVQPQSLVTPLAGSGVSVSNCTSQPQMASIVNAASPGSTIVTCSISIPSGLSAVSVPVTYGSTTSGTIVAAVSGTGIASSVTFAASEVPGFAQDPPAPVTDLTVSGSSATSVTLSWLTPASTPPLTGYQLVTTQPNGTVSTSTIPIASVTVAGNTSSAVVTLPSTQAGFWVFNLAGTNAGGNGLSGTVTSYLGSGPPPAPVNLTAEENPDSTVTLTWTPITAVPPVSGYTIVPVDPAGVPRNSVTVLVPSYTTGALGMLGTWTFNVTATNTAGTSPAATVTVPLLGSAPSAPVGLAITANSSGQVSAGWGAPTSSIPVPNSYVLRAYDSTGRLVRSLTIASSGLISTFNVPDFFSLGTNSPTGSWTFTVSARNATGAGQTARSILQVTPGLISAISKTQTLDSDLAEVPTMLSDLDAFECRSGFSVVSTFGSCSKRVWTPRS